MFAERSHDPNMTTSASTSRDVDRPTRVSFRGGRIIVDFARREVRVDGQLAKLCGRALDVLAALIERRSRLVTKQELLDLVWLGVVVEENNVEVQVFALRKIFGRDAIVNVHRHGYRFALVPDDATGYATEDGGPRRFARWILGDTLRVNRW